MSGERTTGWTVDAIVRLASVSLNSHHFRRALEPFCLLSQPALLIESMRCARGGYGASSAFVSVCACCCCLCRVVSARRRLPLWLAGPIALVRTSHFRFEFARSSERRTGEQAGSRSGSHSVGRAHERSERRGGWTRVWCRVAHLGVCACGGFLLSLKGDCDCACSSCRSSLSGWEGRIRV